MLRTVCSAFEQSGHEVTTIVSPSIGPASRYLGASHQLLRAGDLAQMIHRLAPKFEYVFVIAPETRGILSRLTKAAESTGRVLSCPSPVVDLVSDKQVLLARAAETRRTMSAPPWLSAKPEPREISSAAAEIGFPCVVKPATGAGSIGLTVVRANKDIAKAVARLHSSGCGKAIVQALVRGKHLSAAFIAKGGKILPLSLTSQLVDPSRNFAYDGGFAPQHLPVEASVWRDISSLGERMNFDGIMGADFVYDGEDVYLMEINPRMTTSFIGLSRILTPGIVSALLDESPKEQRSTRYANWRIFPISKSLRYSEGIAERFLQRHEIVSPPFPVGEFLVREKSAFLACTLGPDLSSSRDEMEELLTRLREMGLPC